MTENLYDLTRYQLIERLRDERARHRSTMRDLEEAQTLISVLEADRRRDRAEALLRAKEGRR